MYYLLDNSHTYSCTIVELSSHSSYNMAVMLWTVLVGQPLHSTVQHDLSIKKPTFSCRCMGNECIPSQILVTSVMVSEGCDYCPPNPLMGRTDDKQPATACAVYWCEIMNGWNCKVIWIVQKALISFSMLASWSQTSITFTWCKETGLIYKRNKQFYESYNVHSRANPLTYQQGWIPHCHAARMTTALFYITVTTSKLANMNCLIPWILMAILLNHVFLKHYRKKIRTSQITT